MDGHYVLSIVDEDGMLRMLSTKNDIPSLVVFSTEEAARGFATRIRPAGGASIIVSILKNGQQMLTILGLKGFARNPKIAGAVTHANLMRTFHWA